MNKTRKSIKLNICNIFAYFYQLHSKKKKGFFSSSFLLPSVFLLKL